jgi:hypothetical protein
MITFLAPIAAALVAASIEAVRINAIKGIADNVNKLWTITIGVILFVVCLSLSVGYYDDVLPHHVLVYVIYFAACRGVIYDITLNLLRGLEIDYKSATTNSRIDQFTNKYRFWMTRAIYAIISAITGTIWQQLLLHSI